MGYILMQFDDSPKSLVAIKDLAATRKYLFYLSLDGLRLQPVLFGSRTNIPYKRNYFSFVSKVTRRQ